MNVMNEFVVKDFWWWNLGKMSTHISVHKSGRRGRGVGHNQPTVKVVHPVVPITHADLAAMKQRYRDLLFEVLAQHQPVQQTQSASIQTIAASV